MIFNVKFADPDFVVLKEKCYGNIDICIEDNQQIILYH